MLNQTMNQDTNYPAEIECPVSGENIVIITIQSRMKLVCPYYRNIHRKPTWQEEGISEGICKNSNANKSNYLDDSVIDDNFRICAFFDKIAKYSNG